MLQNPHTTPGVGHGSVRQRGSGTTRQWPPSQWLTYQWLTWHGGTDAKNSGHSRHWRTVTTTNANGGAARPAPEHHTRHQTRIQHPERSTDHGRQTDWQSMRQPVA